jgi:hypothetical protein
MWGQGRRRPVLFAGVTGMACKGSGVQIPSAPPFPTRHSCSSVGVTSEQRSLRRSDPQRGRVSKSLHDPDTGRLAQAGCRWGSGSACWRPASLSRASFGCCEDLLYDLKPPPAGPLGYAGRPAGAGHPEHSGRPCTRPTGDNPHQARTRWCPPAAAVLGRQTRPTFSPSRLTRFYDGGEKEIIIGGGLPSATMKTRGMTQPASDR